MALSDWQFSFNGLTCGAGTNFQLIDIKGLNRPDSRTDEVDIAGGSGSYVFAQLLVARRIEFSGDVTGTPGSEFQGRIDQLEAAFVPQLNPLPLVYKLAGGSEKTAQAVPEKFVYDVNPMYSIGYAEWTVLFVAGNPTVT